MLHWCRVLFYYFNCATFYPLIFCILFLTLILIALASLSLDRPVDVLLIYYITSLLMGRGFTSPNFDAARPHSNSLSHVSYYFFLLRRGVIVATPCIFLLDFRCFIPFLLPTKPLAFQPLATPFQVLRRRAARRIPTATLKLDWHESKQISLYSLSDMIHGARKFRETPSNL